MRVELNIDVTNEEAFAVLHVPKLTPTLQAAIELLEHEGEQAVITAQAHGKVYIIDPEQIEVIRTEGRELVLYNRVGERYVLNRPLYELQEVLGKNFIRISKSAIINLRRIHHVEAAFNGTMEVVMHNGTEEIITRSFKGKFKERLGI